MSYTKEPWPTPERDSADGSNNEWWDIPGIGGGFALESDATRAVACVNACAGTPTEWLEQNAPVVLLGPPISDRFLEIERQLNEATQKNATIEAALAESRANDMAAMRWLCDARFASGDNGKSMLPEFIEYLKAMKAQRDDLLACCEAALLEDDGLSCADALRESIEKAKGGTE